MSLTLYFIVGLQERLLVDTRFLNSVNNITLFQTIDDIRKEYNLQWNLIDALICDSATCNIKLYKTIKEGIHPKIILMRCWPHLIDIVSDIWQNSPLNNGIHKVIAKFQHLMNKSASRKSRFIQYLKDQKVPKPRTMPKIVLTRWNTWYEAIEYLAEFIDFIAGFLKVEKKRT